MLSPPSSIASTPHIPSSPHGTSHHTSMPPNFTFRDSLNESPHITLGRKAWRWYTSKYRKTGISERDLWECIINEIGPGRQNKDVSLKQRDEGKYPITYPPDSEGYQLLQEHISFRYDVWFTNEERYKIPVVISPEPEPLDVQICKSISNILNGGSWIMDGNNGESTSSKKVTLERCTDSEHFIRTALYPAWKTVCDFHKSGTATIFCFGLPYDHSNLAFEVIDAMASYQKCSQTKFRVVLDSSKYTDDQMVELLTTDRPPLAGGDKELIMEVTDGSVEARTALIQQVDDFSLVIDATSNSCILQAIRDPAIHFSLTGKKGDAPRPWGILKFIVNWEERGFYERALKATGKIPSGPARMPGVSKTKPTARPASFSVYRDMPILKPKPNGRFPILPLRPSPTENLSDDGMDMIHQFDASDNDDEGESDNCDDDRYRFLLALWLERKRPVDDIVRENCPEFELEPGYCLPEEARLDLMEALLDEELSDTFEILEDFYSGGHFLYNELDVEKRWNDMRVRMQALHRKRSGGGKGGLKGGMGGSASSPVKCTTQQESSYSQDSGPLMWEDPELIRGEVLGWAEPLEKGGVLLENHFDRRFPDLFIDLVYDVRYQWMDPGFGQIFNPTFYFCKHGIIAGSKNHLASSVPRIKHAPGPSLDVERVHYHNLKKPLETTKPAVSTATDGGPMVTVSTPSTIGPDRSSRAAHTHSKTSSATVQSRPLGRGWVPFGHRKAWSASVLGQGKPSSPTETPAKVEEGPSSSDVATTPKAAGQERRRNSDP